ncbi:Fusaric acid resistance protein-like-domain-containing protein [Radiomyces spectabilis]|uniref:Fusaric acid resistance protein-like-domain-containing protein n=1 Tax=Radiomyces spectabilis TaxID=64574 RepID=UPI00221F7C48|nr:Fusaric acid resistance protein-like-domain-containing protein [Radiomyces spectabilis]KAI8381006.1 Fusaric acid resistance protein-like-domain-containing protein [Radiomyces spectabilis]
MVPVPSRYSLDQQDIPISSSINSFQSYYSAAADTSSQNLRIPWSSDKSHSTCTPNEEVIRTPLCYYGSLEELSRSQSSYLDTFSEYEVVLDDGTRQKRSVSLTTIPTLRFDNFCGFVTKGDRLMEGEDEIWSASKVARPKALLQNEAHTIGETTALLSDRLQSDSDSDHASTPIIHSNHSKPPRRNRQRRHGIVKIKQWFQKWQLSYKQKMVLKCSTAFMLSSLFTFAPFLNDLIGGPNISSHVVATVTLFFNPSKSVGDMIEAVAFALSFTAAAMLFSTLSMLHAIYLRSQERYWTSCIVTLGFWLASSTFFVSFIKARYAKPSIASACGIAFMIIFPVIVREGPADRTDFDPSIIQETFKTVILGTTISAAVCFFMWPMTATNKLRIEIDETLTSIRVLLKLLTKTFLLDADLPDFTANKSLENAINAHCSSFTALQTSFQDAKKEFFHLDMWRHSHEYETIIDSLQRLAQHVGGLRSSCGLQFELLNDNKRKHRTMHKVTKVWSVKADDQRRRLEQELRCDQADSPTHDDNPAFHPSDNAKSPLNRSSRDYFSKMDDSEKHSALGQFIRTVKPPMKSLAYTCKQTILHLQARFSGRTTPTTPSFSLLRQNLAMAIALFEESQHHALTRMFRRKMYQNAKGYLPGELHSQLMTQFPADDVYLVYFFVFCLLEFAKELMVLVESVQSVFEPAMKSDKRGFWLWCNAIFTGAGNYGISKADASKPLNGYVPNNNNTLNTLHTPAPTTSWRKFVLQLWSFFSWFRQHNVRYAAKSMLTAIAVSSIAFIPATQPYFISLRMEWTLITVMAGMAPTVGGTNVTAVLRVFATIAGAIMGYIVYSLFPANRWVLFTFTWLFTIPCFWMMLYHKHGRFGMYALLTYSLVVLHKFNHRADNTVDIFELAWMRCAAVSAGVIIGLIVTTYIWPYEARKELRKGLSDLLLKLSWLYKQLVSEYSETDKTNYEMLIEQVFNVQYAGSDPTKEEIGALIARNKIRTAQFQKVELDLQVSLVELHGLLGHAINEPRLKGKFPQKTYEAMLQSSQNILDKFLSMRVVILKDVWAFQVRRDFVLPASKELMEMAGNVLLYFYLLASALQLKTPLPPYMPPAEKAREMLMMKLQELSRAKMTPTAAKDECYMVYYAYVAIMESIIQELEKLGQHMKDLFGTLVPADQWARCFGMLDLEQCNDLK